MCVRGEISTVALCFERKKTDASSLDGSIIALPYIEMHLVYHQFPEMCQAAKQYEL